MSRNFVDASLFAVILEEAQHILADEEWRVGAKFREKSRILTSQKYHLYICMLFKMGARSKDIDYMHTSNLILHMKNSEVEHKPF